MITVAARIVARKKIVWVSKYKFKYYKQVFFVIYHLVENVNHILKGHLDEFLMAILTAKSYFIAIGWI